MEIPERLPILVADNEAGVIRFIGETDRRAAGVEAHALQTSKVR